MSERWLNCWLHLRPHQWQGWQREDTWLNMYCYHNPMPLGVMANRCSRCNYIKLKELGEATPLTGEAQE